MALNARPTFRFIVDWNDDDFQTAEDIFDDCGAMLISTGVRLDLNSFDARPVNTSGLVELNNAQGQYNAEPNLRSPLRRSHAAALIADGEGVEAVLWRGRIEPPHPGFGVRSVIATADLSTHVEYEAEVETALSGTYANAEAVWQNVVPSSWRSTNNVFPAHLLGYVDWPEGTNLRGFIDLYREATDVYVIEDVEGALSVLSPRAMQQAPAHVSLDTLVYLLDDRYVKYPQSALVRNRVMARGRRVVYGAQTGSGDVSENQPEVVHERIVDVGSVIDFRFRGDVLGFRNPSIAVSLPASDPALPDQSAADVATVNLIYIERADGEIRGRYSVSSPPGVPLPDPPPRVRVTVMAELSRVYEQWRVDNRNDLSIEEFGERPWDAGDWHHPAGLSWTNVGYALDRRDGVLDDPPLEFLQLTVPLWQETPEQLLDVMTKLYQGNIATFEGKDYVLLGRVIQVEDGVRIPKVEVLGIELRHAYRSETFRFNDSNFGADAIFPQAGWVWGSSVFGDSF